MRRPQWLTLGFVAIAAVCVVAIGVLAAVLYWPSGSDQGPPGGSQPPAHTVVIETVDLTISYSTTHPNDTSYFESPECDACPWNGTPMGQWQFQFELQNNDTVVHNVTGITINSPFTFVSVDPSMPAGIAPGASSYFVLTVQLPSSPNYYFLTGAIDTT